jgi:hypothetical protein
VTPFKDPPEALFTQGGAMVEVLNRFGIDGFVLGNRDWLYGTERTLELSRAQARRRLGIRWRRMPTSPANLLPTVPDAGFSRHTRFVTSTA